MAPAIWRQCCQLACARYRRPFPLKLAPVGLSCPTTASTSFSFALRKPVQAKSIRRRRLSNVRVLAIDQTVEEKNGQRVVVGKIATLALNARNAETLVLSTRLGTIALALRSLADAKQADTDEADSTGLRSRAGVNVVRFGQSASDLK